MSTDFPLDRDLLDYFLTLSKFEYALKVSGYCKPPKRNEKLPRPAEPDWSRFADELEPTFRMDADSEVQRACECLLFSPPWREIVFANGKLGWNAAAPDGELPDIERLLVCIRRIRNNLFHGAEFTPFRITDLGRRNQLRSSLVILYEWVRLAPDRFRTEFQTAVLAI